MIGTTKKANEGLRKGVEIREYVEYPDPYLASDIENMETVQRCVVQCVES